MTGGCPRLLLGLGERVEKLDPLAREAPRVDLAALHRSAYEVDEPGEVRLPLARAEIDAEPRAVASAYLEFARANPALYQAMFTLSLDLTFAGSDTPAPLHAGFTELREALAPLAGDRDAETFTEVAWSALHGLATLSQAGRLRPAFYDQRLAMLVDQLATARA